MRVTDNGTTRGTAAPLFVEQSVTINVTKRPTAIAYTGDGSEQYSDQQALSATLVDALTGTALASKPIGFQIGTQTAGATTDAAGVGANGLVLTQDPNRQQPYTVDTAFAGDSAYEPSGDSDAFDITPEDARATYTGALFASTSSATSGSATVTLSATIKDISATADAAGDTLAGDIRKATVTFVNRDNNAVLCTAPAVGLVNALDTKVGTATCNYSANIGTADAQQFTVGIVVGGHYTRSNSTDNAVVTVAKPIPGLVTGGGYLVLESSGGQNAGGAGSKNNFGFNIRNDAKTGPKGNINTIIRRLESDGIVHVYQIKGNAMTSLSQQASALPKTATFNGRANMQDITNPLAPVSISGGASLQVVMTDRGEPGSTDSIAITLWDKNGTLWFSSSWDGTKTVEQVLGGGNLQIR